VITNEDLYYKVAKNIIAWRQSWGPEYKKLHSEQNREDITKWGKDKLAPFLSEEDEVIPRDQWDLDGLVGATSKQLEHFSYTTMRKHLEENFKPKSNIAVVMLCANKKPYRTQQYIKQYYTICQKEGVDFFILSNPGVIPIDYDGHYPYRYYEWNETEETEEIKAKYTAVTRARIYRWFTQFKYKAIVNMVRPGETYDALIDCPIEQKKFTVFTDENIRKINDEYIDRFKGSTGLLKFRMLGLKRTKEMFLEELRKAKEEVCLFT